MSQVVDVVITETVIDVGVTEFEIAVLEVGEAGPPGRPGVGVAPGGTTGQRLTKLSDDDYDTGWSTPLAGSVDSVNGMTGAVTLDAGDVGAQPVDSDLTAIAALATTPFGRALLVLADAAALRLAAALGTSATRDTGTGATNVILGNDARLTDQRTPPDGSVTIAKLSFDPATQAELDAETSARTAADSSETSARTAAVSSEASTRAADDAAEASARATADNLRQLLSEKAQANGYASLDGNALIPSNQLPAIAISTPYSVASQAAMLALTAQEGDIAIRSDISKSFILKTAGNPTVLADWLELRTPTDAVQSVDGRTGTVSLSDLYDAAGAAAAAQAASQPLDSDLTAIAALSTTSFGRALLVLADAATLRTSAGLGDIATHAVSEFQPIDSDLTAIAALATTSFGRSLLTSADAAALRTAAGLGSLATLSTITTSEITDGTIANADLANMANKTFKGRHTAGTGVPEDVTAANLKADLAIAAGDVSGLGDAATKNTGTTAGTLAAGDDSRFTAVSVNTQTASYTLVLADAGLVVEMNNASANNLTVPPNSSVAFPIGTVIEVFQLGAGQTTVVAGSGVTLRSDGAKLKAAAQYATIGLRKRGTDEWVVSGDVSV